MRTTFSGPVKSDNGFEGGITLPGYLVAALPPVVVNGLIVVTDANTGAGTVCFGKGTSWIDISTGVAVVA